MFILLVTVLFVITYCQGALATLEELTYMNPYTHFKGYYTSFGKVKYMST